MKRYQVFISSTYTDLKEERQAVLESILKLRHIPVGMEQFVATSEEQFEYIKRLIDETDYYILIIGNRYGSLTNDGISFTEKEFDYAASKDVPILAFVHSSPDTLPVSKSDVIPSIREQLSKFREKVMDHRLVSLFSWNSPATLAREVVTALSNAIRDYPRPGWERVHNETGRRKDKIEIYDPDRAIHLQMMDMEYPFEHERIMSAFASIDGSGATATTRRISKILEYGSREYRYPLNTITGPFPAIASFLKESTFLNEAEAMTLLAVCGLKVSSEEVSGLVKSLEKWYKVKEPITYDYHTLAEWKNSFSRIVFLCRFNKYRAKPIIYSNLPSMVSFFSLYGVETASKLDVRSRWEKADYTKTLAVPVGIDEGDNPYYWDLHEKNDGPNAIIAGMVGSGKTEFLVAYLLSLAINYPPDAVGFMVIDCKGGWLTDILHSIPHYLGGLSDLNGKYIRQLIHGLQAEVERRQLLLRHNGAFNIDEYLALYHNRGTSIPMPHVFIVIDEFGDFKREYPELHSEILRLAQIGRMIGFHFIWATQRPSGVIDERIWSLAKTRICMKVVREEDSIELLKIPDASYINTPGRGYIQSGFQPPPPTLIQFVFGGETTLFGTTQTDEITTDLHGQFYEPKPDPLLLPPMNEDDLNG